MAQASTPVTVTITVQGVNDAPVAVGDSITAIEGVPYVAQLALDVGTLGQVDQFDHVDQLVQLLGDLLDDRLVTGGDQGHARQRRVLGRGDGERLDVVTAR